MTKVPENHPWLLGWGNMKAREPIEDKKLEGIMINSDGPIKANVAGDDQRTEEEGPYVSTIESYQIRSLNGVDDSPYKEALELDVPGGMTIFIVEGIPVGFYSEGLRLSDIEAKDRAPSEMGFRWRTAHKMRETFYMRKWGSDPLLRLDNHYFGVAYDQAYRRMLKHQSLEMRHAFLMQRDPLYNCLELIRTRLREKPVTNQKLKGTLAKIQEILIKAIEDYEEIHRDD